MSIFENPVLVTLSGSDSFIQIMTVDLKHGKSQCFCFSSEAAAGLLREEYPMPVMEKDLMNFCTVSRNGDQICFRMSWFRRDACTDEYSGYQQQFSMQKEKVERALAGEEVKHLSWSSSHRRARLTFTETAYEIIADIVKDKLKRHALGRYFRDNLNYENTERISICGDSTVDGFSFFTFTGPYGGIVPHETEIVGRDGRKYRRISYSTHT